MEFDELSQHVIDGDAEAAKAWTEAALAQQIDPHDILDLGLAPGMAVVGHKFKNFEYYMPEVLVSARAMKTSIAILKPLLAHREGGSLGKVVIGTVRGDLHDIGKNLVAMMLEGAGFEIIDLGTDVSPEQFVSGVEQGGAQMVCLSALLTTTIPEIKATIDALRASEQGVKAKIMVGGAPVTDKYATAIGADGWASEAASAVETAKELAGSAS